MTFASIAKSLIIEFGKGKSCGREACELSDYLSNGSNGSIFLADPYFLIVFKGSRLLLNYMVIMKECQELDLDCLKNWMRGGKSKWNGVNGYRSGMFEILYQIE